MRPLEAEPPTLPRYPRHREGLPEGYVIDIWRESDIPGIIALEQQSWPPWLQKPPEAIEYIAKHFADTQLLVRNGDKVVATLTTNRIQLDGGTIKPLTTWDEIAGGSVGKSNYADTYNKTGNTLCLMSANVHEDVKGQRLGLASSLIEELAEHAQSFGVEYLVGPFRPSGYGNYKLEQFARSEPIMGIRDYSLLKNNDGELYDHWFRTALQLGLVPFRVEPRSMRVNVSLEQFENYKKTYRPPNNKRWTEITKGHWECGQAGMWIVQSDHATYIEANYWHGASLPLHPLRRQ